MKLYSSVREILSAVLSVPALQNGMDIMHPGNVDIDAPYAPVHSFDFLANL